MCLEYTMLFAKIFVGEMFIKSLDIIKLIIITPFLIRYLGVENYGLYTYIIATAGILTILFNVGTSELTKTYYNLSDDSEQKKQIGSVYIVSLFTAGIFISFAMYNTTISDFIDMDIQYLILCSITALSHVFSGTILQIAQYQRKLRKVYFLHILNFVLFCLVILYVMYFDKSLYEFILYYVYAQTLYLVACLLYLSELSLNFSIDLNYIKNGIMKSIFFMFHSLTIIGLTYADRIVIKNYMTDYDLGIYSLSSNIVLLLIGSLSSFLFPIIKIKINENINSKEKISKIRYLTDNVINVLFVPIIIGLAVYGYNFIIFYAGDDFMQSYQYMIVLLIPMYIHLILYFYTEKYILQQKLVAIQTLFKINVFALFVNVTLNIVTIPEYGLWGAAVSTLISAVITFLYVLYITKSLYMMRGAVKYVLPAIIAWGGGGYLWDNSYGFWWMWVYCIFSMLIYWTLIYILYKKDMKNLYSLMKAEND